MGTSEVIFPVKIYKLGEPQMTINAESDLDHWLAQGFSLTPQVYSHQEFPKVMYASDGSWLSVKSQAEMDEALKNGYLKTPGSFGVSEAEIKPESESTAKDYLTEQVNYHEARAEVYRCKLEELYPSSDNSIEEKKAVLEPNEKNEIPRKRGRKKLSRS
jgi:hypothetical protein